MPDRATAASGVVEAWRASGGAAPARVEALRPARRSKPGLDRLDFDAQPSVFAKHGPPELLAVERHVYGGAAAAFAIGRPRARGEWVDPDGTAWLFIEALEGHEPSGCDPAHQRLAGRWLGRLHAVGAGLTPGSLPEAGPARYLAHLRSGRAALRAGLGNRALTADGRALLIFTADHLDHVEAGWHAIERAAAGWPQTLVHGDFQTRNARLWANRHGSELRVFDWEMAGWGSPAIDLGSACGPGLGIRIDVDAYLAEVRERWPALDREAVRRLAALGRIFRSLAGIDWECSCLRFETADDLAKPLSCLPLYVRRIDDTLAAETSWLA